MTGEIISNLRKERKITQAALAEYLGVSSAAIYKYERNLAEPDIASLIKIAELFDVSLDYLVGRTNIRYFGEATPAGIESDIKKGEGAINSEEPAIPYTLEDIHAMIDDILIKHGVIKMEDGK